MLKNKKCLILIIILIAIIIAGAIVFITKGMNYSVKYDNSVSLQIDIDSIVEMKDIKNISSEVFINKEVSFANTNKSSKQILITVKEASQDEINLLVEKINDKYETEITIDDIEIINNYKVNFVDIIKLYLLPVGISLVVIFIYFGIIYRKNKVLEVLVYTIIIPIIVQLVYFSFLAITRLPISITTMPISMLIFIISILAIAYVFSNKYTNNVKENKKK